MDDSGEGSACLCPPALYGLTARHVSRIPKEHGKTQVHYVQGGVRYLLTHSPPLSPVLCCPTTDGEKEPDMSER